MNITEKEKLIVNSILKFNKEQNSVSVSQYIKLRYKPTLPDIYKVFVSWSEALRAAGLAEDRKNKPVYSHADKDRILHEFKAHLDKDPSLISRKNYATANLQPSAHVINNHFMSWRNALSLIGIDYGAYLKKKRMEDRLGSSVSME